MVLFVGVGAAKHRTLIFLDYSNQFLESLPIAGVIGISKTTSKSRIIIFLMSSLYIVDASKQRGMRGSKVIINIRHRIKMKG